MKEIDNDPLWLNPKYLNKHKNNTSEKYNNKIYDKQY
jgi:hypothetical protein